ncbi:unnamed protein product, partial [Mesorhabditis belari]|uniref:RING-type E3 ubiquitin transferase n=1 Tax=Mesorhabditis belari TaxID=2138241 RepID=A0AAF3EFW9_9BILA
MRRRSRLDSEIDCTKNHDENSRILIRERNEVLRWKSSVEIKTPNLFIPPQIATFIESLPFAKFAVSKEANRFALLSHSPDRKLELYSFDNHVPYAESEIEIPDDDFASYCMLHFTNSSLLLLATRSNCFIDVFDCYGYLCYTIPLECNENNFDLMGAVCCLQTVAIASSSDDPNKFYDHLYVLQYNGNFSIYKIGKLSGYFKVCSLNLNVGLCGSFYFLQSCNLILVSTHYKKADAKPIAGLSTFRLVDGPPHVEAIRVAKTQSTMTTILSRLPFSFGSYAYLCSMTVDQNEKTLYTISTSGDLFVFELPSARLAYSVPYISGSKPRQVEFVDEDEVCVLLSCGSIIRATKETLFNTMHEYTTDEKYSPRAEIQSPTIRQMFALENQGADTIMEEVSKQRTQFTVRLWLETIWSACIQLIRITVGDPASPLTKASRVEMLEFIFSHSPTITLQELFERTLNEKDYSRALSLASFYTTIDSDIVRKNQWKDACKTNLLTIEMIDEILGQINDVEFRAAACWASNTSNRDVQQALITMGLDIGDLAPLESRIRILHLARLMDVLSEQEMFLELRERSLLEIAVYLAERVELRILEQLIEHNLSILSPFILSIVEFIPPSVSPEEYEIFLPTNGGPELQIIEKPNPFNRILNELAFDEEGELYVEQMNCGNGFDNRKIQKQSGQRNFVEWLRRRGEEIDEDCGLPDIVIQLYNIAQERGFDSVNIQSELQIWHLYQKHIDFCSSVTGSREKFLKMGPEALVQQYTKLSDGEVSQCLDHIIELIAWKMGPNEMDPAGTTRNLLSPLLFHLLPSGARTLLKLHELRPDLANQELTIACLKETQKTGEDLLEMLKELNFDRRYQLCLSHLLRYNVKPTFSTVFDAFNDRMAALGIFLKFVSSGSARCKTETEWEELRDSVLYLQETVFPNLDQQDALEILVREYLACDEIYSKPDSLLLFLALSPSKDTPTNKLSFSESIQTVLEKCEEFLQNSTGRNDQLLSKARFLATAVSPKSKDATSFLKKLEVVDLALDLGYSKMPVSIQYIEPNMLLEEVVSIERNYKLGKKVARLAVVLAVDTPVATALSLCALEALERDDIDVVQKYLAEIMAKARGIEKVYQLCIQLIKMPVLQELRDDIYACALLNAPGDELEKTLELITQQQETTSTSFLNEKNVEISSDLILDPMYSEVAHYIPSKKAEQFEKDLFEETKRGKVMSNECALLMAKMSSSHALGLALLMHNAKSNPWTSNDFLLNYEEAINFHYQNLTDKIVEVIPPKKLISLRVTKDETCSALDRLTIYGCDRERFIEDIHYRKETIVGLAMTEDELIFKDALDLAKDFSVNPYDVHFASLENAITSLSPSVASKLIKERGHIAVLHKKIEEFQEDMRTAVFRLVATNDAFRLYLSVFGDQSSERKAIPALKKLAEFSEKHHLSLNLKRAFNEVTYLAQILTNFSDSELNNLAPLLKPLPKGPDAIESLVRFLVEGTELRPPANVITLWTLLDGNSEAFLDLIAIKSRDEEIAYLKAVPPSLPEKLDELIKKRLTELNADEQQQQQEQDPHQSITDHFSFQTFTENLGLTSRMDVANGLETTGHKEEHVKIGENGENGENEPGTSNDGKTSAEDVRQAANNDEDDDQEHHMCRVCRNDEGHLYYPCLCTGSIKFVHQECLVEWLKYSKKEVCELCNYKYSFQPIYRSDMPKVLPIVEIVKGIMGSVGRIVKTWLLYTIVLLAWVGIVPLTAARIYQAVFSANIHNIIALPLHIFNTENVLADCVKGIFLLAIFVCTFVSLVWLREQIIHGGPQEWLQLDVHMDNGEDGDVQRRRRERRERRVAAREQQGQQEQHEEQEQVAHDQQEHASVEQAPLREELPEEQVDFLPSEEQILFQNPEQETTDGNESTESISTSDNESDEDEEEDDTNSNEGDAHVEEGQPGAEADPGPAAEEGWRDWDRLGDELTWQRLIGLDGSFVFIEHVFWVIALNTLFTVLFAFSPFKLGSWILLATGIRAKITFFPSLASILTGYLAISVIVFFVHGICGALRFKGLYRLLGIVYLVLKVFLLVLVEIAAFPILCGWWMDLCSLVLFQATLSSRINSFAASPTSSLFIHWMIGMIYVFYSASFVLLLREVLRPGVLWFMRNLNDPEFNPIMEMIELPVSRHLRRLVASTSLFFMAILLVIYVPLRIIQNITPQILPYNLSLTAETPLSELSLELLILQIVLPALLEQTSARVVLKKFVRAWCVVVGRVLNLDQYLLSENHPPQQQRPPPPPEQQQHGPDERNLIDELADLGEDPAEVERQREVEREERIAEQNAQAQINPQIDIGDDDGLMGNGGLAAEHQALLLLREPMIYEPYQRPSVFPLRIIALLVALSVSATFISTLCFIIPVLIGRFFIYTVAATKNVHELYTISSGLYICWLFAKFSATCIEWFNRGRAQLSARFHSTLRWVGRMLLVLFPALFVIPYLIGLSFQLVVVAPLRVGLDQTPIYFPWQEWAMGVLHMKIFVAAVMMGPEWWMRAAFEQIYQQGVPALDVRFIYREVLIPVIVVLSMQIAAPYALGHLLNTLLGASPDEAVVVLRFSYPFCLSVIGVAVFVVWQIHKLGALAQHIRNEKYLVGTQLVNYERRTEEKAAESTASGMDLI